MGMGIELLHGNGEEFESTFKNLISANRYYRVSNWPRSKLSDPEHHKVAAC